MPRVCAWLGLSASPHSHLIAGLTVTTLLYTSRLHTEERRIGERREAGTLLPYGAINNLLPSQQNCIEEGREGKEEEDKGKKKIQRILLLQM